jgi:hypothetical protein
LQRIRRRSKVRKQRHVGGGDVCIFLMACKSIGLSDHQQLRYLQVHRDLHPEAKKIMYDNDPVSVWGEFAAHSSKKILCSVNWAYTYILDSDRL